MVRGKTKLITPQDSVGHMDVQDYQNQKSVVYVKKPMNL